MTPKIKKSDWHFIVMVLCFIYGGISLLFFVMQLSPFMNANGGPPGRGFEINISGNFSGPSDAIEGNFSRRVFLEPEISRFFYLIIFVSLFGSFVSITAGLSLMSLLRKKERKELTKGLIDTMTTPEEKLVIRVLNENGGELTQSELVRRTKLSKVKVHRVIKRLESLNIVDKYSYGLTNKIKLNESVFEGPDRVRNRASTQAK
jgi:ribosomal protein S25